VANLRELAADLIRWNKKVFGNLFRRKCQLWARIEGVQRSLAEGGPRYLLKLDRELRLELDKTLDQIALLWFQKARVEQIRDGDRNTKYFHTSTIIRRRMNRIEALTDSEKQWCVDPGRIKRLVVDHFQQLFAEDDLIQVVRGRIPSRFPPLSPSQIQTLGSPFTKEDI